MRNRARERKVTCKRGKQDKLIPALPAQRFGNTAAEPQGRRSPKMNKNKLSLTSWHPRFPFPNPQAPCWAVICFSCLLSSRRELYGGKTGHCDARKSALQDNSILALPHPHLNNTWKTHYSSDPQVFSRRQSFAVPYPSSQLEQNPRLQ